MATFLARFCVLTLQNVLTQIDLLDASKVFVGSLKLKKTEQK